MTVDSVIDTLRFLNELGFSASEILLLVVIFMQNRRIDGLLHYIMTGDSKWK